MVFNAFPRRRPALRFFLNGVAAPAFNSHTLAALRGARRGMALAVNPSNPSGANA